MIASMNDIDELVKRIQQGHLECLPLLQDFFNPLLISWLRKIRQLHKPEEEDYRSIAKIILLECSKNFDFKRGVRFEAYYKITLYHWYGNQIKKKQLYMIDIAGEIETVYVAEETDHMEIQEKKLVLEKHMAALNIQEKKIFSLLIQGMKVEEIARQLKLSKKTILNKKYMIISKLKNAILEEERNEKRC